MRSLLTLSLAFALLATYMEVMVSPATASMSSPASAKIIRQPGADTNTSVLDVSIIKPKAQPEIKTLITAKTIHRPRPTLNLQLPFSNNAQQPILNGKSPLARFFNQRPKETISYNAELVFDAERGENITGGKVNIKIPFG